MTVLWAESALLPEGFADGVRLEVDARGDLAAVVDLEPDGFSEALGQQRGLRPEHRHP